MTLHVIHVGGSLTQAFVGWDHQPINTLQDVVDTLDEMVSSGFLQEYMDDAPIDEYRACALFPVEGYDWAE